MRIIKRNTDKIYTGWRNFGQEAADDIGTIREWGGERSELCIAIMLGSKLIAKSILHLASVQKEHNEILRGQEKEA